MILLEYSPSLGHLLFTELADLEDKLRIVCCQLLQEILGEDCMLLSEQVRVHVAPLYLPFGLKEYENHSLVDRVYTKAQHIDLQCISQFQQFGCFTNTMALVLEDEMAGKVRLGDIIRTIGTTHRVIKSKPEPATYHHGIDMQVRTLLCEPMSQCEALPESIEIDYHIDLIGQGGMSGWNITQAIVDQLTDITPQSAYRKLKMALLLRMRTILSEIISSAVWNHGPESQHEPLFTVVSSTHDAPGSFQTAANQGILILDLNSITPRDVKGLKTLLQTIQAGPVVPLKGEERRYHMKVIQLKVPLRSPLFRSKDHNPGMSAVSRDVCNLVLEYEIKGERIESRPSMTQEDFSSLCLRPTSNMEDALVSIMMMEETAAARYGISRLGFIPLSEGEENLTRLYRVSEQWHNFYNGEDQSVPDIHDPDQEFFASNTVYSLVAQRDRLLARMHHHLLRVISEMGSAQ
ncbi:hypothetical protein DFQ26_006246 [Actinomortierella ambigua]|nr:hypothetical protein DFQ26_006246 [Actinomortierella ambigua]